jgi:hypothetical protein
MKAVVLTIDRGSRLHLLTEDKLKGLVEINIIRSSSTSSTTSSASMPGSLSSSAERKIMERYSAEYRGISITDSYQRVQKDAYALLTPSGTSTMILY